MDFNGSGWWIGSASGRGISVSRKQIISLRPLIGNWLYLIRPILFWPEQLTTFLLSSLAGVRMTPWGAFYLHPMIGSAFTSHLTKWHTSLSGTVHSHSSGELPSISSTFAIQDCHKIKFILFLGVKRDVGVFSAIIALQGFFQISFHLSVSERLRGRRMWAFSVVSASIWME